MELDVQLYVKLVLWTDKLCMVLLAELSVPWESNVDYAYEWKMTKCADLKVHCEDQGRVFCVYPVEIRCRGFASGSGSFLISV